MRKNPPLLLIAIGCSALLACGSNSTDSGDSDDGSPSSPPPAGGTVVPVGLDLSFIQGRDMELSALTLQEGTYGPEFRGYLYSAATKLQTVVVQDLTVGPYASSGTTVSGKVQNGGTASIFLPRGSSVLAQRRRAATRSELHVRRRRGRARLRLELRAVASGSVCESRGQVQLRG